MVQLKLPRSSNLRYLAMVYFLPEDFIACCPTLRKLPRNLREIMQSPEIVELIKSEQFFNEIADATAALVFPHFGFSGWKEDYSGYSPVWKLSYSLPLWIKHIREVTGWSMTALLNLPETQEIPFFDRDFIMATMEIVVKRTIAEKNWQPILDVVRKMPCEEDYEPSRPRSRVKIDWLRKWYHTRSKTTKTISLEGSIENKKHYIHGLTVDSFSMEEQIESKDYVQRFKERLSEKDMAILELRVQGYIYEDIAKKLGYKNHSGVLKRIKIIAAEYEKYEEENKQKQYQ